MKSRIPLNTGDIFGRLVVIEDCGSQEVYCLCECLAPVVAMRHRLRQGIIRSCPACTKLYGWQRQRLKPKEAEGRADRAKRAQEVADDDGSTLEEGDG